MPELVPPTNNRPHIHETPELSSQPSLDSNRQPRELCKKCNQMIVEGHAYELGDDRWHIHCFNCSKCNTSLGCNSNFLVLGNGNLICSNCSYNCKQCGRKIDDLAILTGDQAYCSNCFKCRSCKNKIEDLRYARTSKGLFCMDCHQKLMAKKKKYDAKKKHLALLQEKRVQLEREKDQRELQILEDHKRSVNSSRNSLIQSYMNNQNNQSGESLLYQQNNRSVTSVTSSKNKSLPLPPTSTSPARPTPYSANSYQSKESIFGKNKTDTSLGSLSTSQTFSEHTNKGGSTMHSSTGLHNPPIFQSDNDFSIEEVQNSSDSDSNGDEKKSNSTSLRNKSSNRNSRVLPFVNQYSTPPLSSDHLNTDEISADTGERTVYLDVIDTPPESQADPLAGNQLKPALDVSPGRNTEQKSKSFLILSPNQFHDNEFHNTRSPMIDSPGTIISLNSNQNTKAVNLSVEDRPRSACPSPFAKVNRQARVVETNDEILTDGVDEDLAIGTPRQEHSRAGTLKSVSSPPPKVPLPSTPSRGEDISKKFSFVETPKGLGLEGVDYDNHEDQRSYIKLQQDQRQHDISEKTSPSSIMSTPKRVVGNFSPAVTNLEPKNSDLSNDQQHKHLQKNQNVSRTASLIKNLKHKRSTSGNQNKLAALFTTGSKEDHRNGHTRQTSDGSLFSSIANAYISPPITNGALGGRNHIRLTSDSTVLLSDEDHHYSNVAVKNDIEQLNSSKVLLEEDVKKLRDERHKLNEQLKMIQSKISSESIRYDNLVAEISELQIQKTKITNENKDLIEQQKNRQASGATGKLSTSSSNDSDPDASTLGKSVNTHLSPYKSSSDSTLVVSRENFEYLDHLSPDRHQGQFQQHQQYQQQYQQQQPQQQLIEDEQAHKATRLKFWRRPKVGTTQVILSNEYNNNGNGHNNGARIPNSFSTQALRIPAHNSGSSFNNNGANNNNQQNKFSKSKSSNVLDSLLSGDSSQVPLFNSTLQQRAEYEKSQVPIIITRCLAEVEKRGLDFEGIYRISGGNSAIVSIENAFSSLSNDPDEKQLNRVDETLDVDIHAVTSALKRYLRKLPDPVIPFDLYDDFIKVSTKASHSKEVRIAELQKIVNKLPPANRETLRLIVNHLHLVNSLKDINKMGYKNLSVVFAPTLAKDESGVKEMTDMGFRNDTTELLLTESHRIF